ncbi:hypothetical protein QOI_0482 [Clostridioides difficile Y21]|nr:hypothetical protein QOI_0482 [Clostridioides difficile Y21]
MTNMEKEILLLTADNLEASKVTLKAATDAIEEAKQQGGQNQKFKVLQDMRYSKSTR